MIHPVILSGGLGTRLWPLSRAARPKQLLPLASERSMLQETALRVAGYPGIGAPVVVCNQEHRFLVAEQMRAIDMALAALFLEPMGRNTAPAAAVAALHLARQDPGARMLLLPADHLIRDVSAFHASVAAADAAVDRVAWRHSGSFPLRPRPATTISSAARASTEATRSTSRASSKNRTWTRRATWWRRAIISGTAACSCSRAGNTWTSWRGTGPRFWQRARRRWTRAGGTWISAASARPILPRARPTRSIMPSWNIPARRRWCRPRWGGTISAPGRRSGRWGRATRRAM